MDVRFAGSPSVCGVYRLEFLGWGGWTWELYAKLHRRERAGFRIYSNICDALNSWKALPNLIISDVEILDNRDCPRSVRLRLTVTNTGCQGAVNVPVVVESSTGDPPQPFVIPRVDRESSVLQELTVGPFSTRPVDLTVYLDPGTPGAVVECSEAGTNPVTCSPPDAVAHAIIVPACPAACGPGANVRPDRIGNVLQGAKLAATHAVWSWTGYDPLGDLNAYFTRLYVSPARDVSPLDRRLVSEQSIVTSSHTERVRSCRTCRWATTSS